MKGMKDLLAGQSTYQRPDAPVEEAKHDSAYAYWIDKTAKLIGRTYIETHGIVRGWPVHKIERRYKLAIDPPIGKTGQPIPQDIYWWYLRKKDKAGV